MEIADIGILWYFIPMIFFLGIVTSYDDVKAGKIRNKWVACALAYSFAVLSLLVLSMYLSDVPVSIEYINAYAINLGFSLFAGLFIWSAGLWSAGDAKLFLAFSALIPLTVYRFVNFEYFPSFVILVNSFIPIFVFFFVKIFMSTNSREKIESVKKSLDPHSILSSVITVLGISAVISALIELLNIPSNVFVNLFFIFVAYYVMDRIFGRDLLKAMAALFIITMAFSYGNVMTLQFMQFFLIMLFSFVFIRYFILNLAFDAFTTPVYIEKLMPGMLPAEIVRKAGKKYVKVSNIQYSIIPDFGKGRSKGIFGNRGLTKKDISMLNRLHSSGKFDSHQLRVHDNIPFAPIIFMGVLLTLVFNGSVFSLLMPA